MASGAQHYQMAEQTLAAIEARRAELNGQAMSEIAIASTSLDLSTALSMAQVHATLALAAATAMAGLDEIAQNGENFYDAEEDAAQNWAKATMPNKAGA
ncbi:MAG TPA: hypothetical protein VIP28_14800 [Nocardioides sp.]